jgi:hypothetical protein
VRFVFEITVRCVGDVQKKLSYWLPTNPSCSPPFSLSPVCTLSLLFQEGLCVWFFHVPLLYLRFPINNRAASQLQHVECCRQRVLLSDDDDDYHTERYFRCYRSASNKMATTEHVLPRDDAKHKNTYKKDYLKKLIHSNQTDQGTCCCWLITWRTRENRSNKSPSKLITPKHFPSRINTHTHTLSPPSKATSILFSMPIWNFWNKQRDPNGFS